MKQVVKKKVSCRVCKKTNLEMVFSFGPTPLANAFLTKKQIDDPEYYFPLDVYFCHSCSFLQLGHVVDPALLFGNYVYVSSTSPVFINHFKDFAKIVIKDYKFEKKSLVIDVGSNDGILLKPFKALGMHVLGVEPAKHIAAIARKDGIPTVAEYFTVPVAKRIVHKYRTAKVITATNVFAHIDDLDEVIKGLNVLLDKDGIFIIEAPYLVDFLQKRYFDLVYHEHLSYWAVGTFITLFKRFNMKVIDVQKVPVHGGSIRVFVTKHNSKYDIQDSVKSFIKKEKKLGLDNIDTYKEYAKEVQENKIALLELLSEIKTNGKKIAGYGAPAKGNTLLNFFSIGGETLDYIIDDSKLKQGLFSPGKHIPVVPSNIISRQKPDYILILAWNFAESIIENQMNFRKNGGKFIIPVPKPTIV